MSNINNTVNYEINVKQKYSWSTVFAWLYLKTVGRILPKKWNKWAENILYYDKATGSNEIRTDDPETTNESAQIDLKPGVAVKESQSGVISKDETTFQNTTMQTEYVETTDKNIEADLKPEVAEKESQSEIISKDETTFQDTTMQTEYVETTDKSFQVNLRPEVAEKESQSEIVSEDEGIQTEVSDEFTSDDNCLDVEEICAEVSNEFTDDDYSDMEEVCTENDQVQQIVDLQLGNDFLEEENRELRSKLAECEKDYTELEDVSGQLEEELSAELKEKSKLIFGLSERLIECNIESLNEIKRPLVEVEKDMKINSLMRLNEELDEELQETRGKIAEQEKLIEQLQKERKQAEKADIKKLQGEKENQEQQKLEEKLKGVDKRLGDIDGETKKSQGQTKTKTPDAVSLVSTVSTGKSTTSSSRSTLSKLRNLPNKLFGDKNLNNFLSRKNEELKKGFPEFKEKHFCHNVLDETIKSLSNKNSGKFESKELLKLLESNLKQSAREIIEAKVKKVVNEHCNIGTNVGKELQDDTLKAKLSSSVVKCVKKLEFNKQEGVNKIVDSILHSFIAFLIIVRMR
ncbi:MULTISPECIES: hypothetical protein [unclassified Wolbachia]|uniref:hypothetical protein n=1 Tax=unclassified Wolbachia TaxID=2640676 RepID=UPI0012509FD3|nr:hypothetical protein [Wolbachia endosymbiont of Nasonia oneida]KAB2977672.1 hypothetical protein DEF52_05935 [Wolbachia endosymbiont of Nasonia oneida]